jgi:hypothetical protein
MTLHCDILPIGPYVKPQAGGQNHDRSQPQWATGQTNSTAAIRELGDRCSDLSSRCWTYRSSGHIEHDEPDALAGRSIYDCLCLHS